MLAPGIRIGYLPQEPELNDGGAERSRTQGPGAAATGAGYVWPSKMVQRQGYCRSVCLAGHALLVTSALHPCPFVARPGDTVRSNIEPALAEVKAKLAAYEALSLQVKGWQGRGGEGEEGARAGG